MSSGQVNVVYVNADKQLKIDFTKSSSGDMTFVTAVGELNIDIATLSIYYVYFTYILYTYIGKMF